MYYNTIVIFCAGNSFVTQHFLKESVGEPKASRIRLLNHLCNYCYVKLVNFNPAVLIPGGWKSFQGFLPSCWYSLFKFGICVLMLVYIWSVTTLDCPWPTLVCWTPSYFRYIIIQKNVHPRIYEMRYFSICLPGMHNLK